MRNNSREVTRPKLTVLAAIATLAFALVAQLYVIPTAAAQSEPEPNSVSPSTWQAEIAEARDALKSTDGQPAAERIAFLEELRAKLATQRDLALTKSRIQPFEAQIAEAKIEALGPVPESGESEFLSKRRQELESQLYELEAPTRAAQDAYFRSEATIQRIDDKIADLQFSQITTRGDFPLWPNSISAFANQANEKATSFLSLKSDAKSGNEEGGNLAFILLVSILGVVGLAILTVGRSRAVARVGRLAGETVTDRQFALRAIGRDFAGLVTMLVGVGALIVAMVALNLIYPQFGMLPTIVAIALLPIVFGYWLGEIVFAPDAAAVRLIDLGQAGGQRAVHFMTLLGVSLGLEDVLEAVERSDPFTSAASSVAPLFVITLLTGGLYGLARTIDTNHRKRAKAKIGEAADRDDAFVSEQIDWSRVVSGALKLSAIVAFLLGLAGFSPLARFAILPMIESLAVVAILTTIYLRITALFSAYAPEALARSKNSMTMVRAALAVIFVVLAAPLVAIFWGVRPAEILDLLVLLRDGITIGDTTISLGTLFVFIGVFVVGYLLTRWVQRILQTMLLARLEIDEGTRSAIVTGTGYVGIMISFVAAVGAAGIDLSNLAIVFGALSVGIGFGLQSIVSNFVSGIIMLVERPIKEGDSIEVGGYAGIVDKISVRATRIQSFDHDDVIIPNSELITGTVRNRTLTDRMTRIECSV